MKEDLLKIIYHYGVDNQQRKFNEEVFELQEAIFKFEHGTYLGEPIVNSEGKAIAHIAEEIADVSVILNQFKEYYSISDEEIEKIMKQKVNRQLDRMSKE